MKSAILAALVILLSSAAHSAETTRVSAQEAFVAAQRKTQAGDLEGAEQIYRALLKVVPTSRIKLELARVLFGQKDNEESLALFKEVYLDPATPAQVRRNILPFVEELQLRMTRVRYGVNIVSDSNPTKVGEGGTIYFNGTPLSYVPPRDKATVYGIEPYLSVEKLWGNDLIGKFYSSARIFPDDDLNRIRARGSFAKRLPQISNAFVQVSLDAEGNRLDSSYVLPSVEGWKSFNLSSRARVGVGGQVGYLFSETEKASGVFTRPYVYGDWTFSPHATILARASIGRLDSKDDYFSYQAPQIDIGLALHAAAIDVTPTLSVTWTRYQNFDPFWQLTRSDTTIRPAVSLSSPLIAYRDIKPVLNVFYENRDSNVEIYDYDQIGFSVNLQKVF